MKITTGIIVSMKQYMNKDKISLADMRDAVETAFRQGFEYGIGSDLDEDESWDNFLSQMDSIKIGYDPGVKA